MLTQLLLATGMIAVTILIHGAGITALARGMRQWWAAARLH